MAMIADTGGTLRAHYKVCPFALSWIVPSCLLLHVELYICELFIIFYQLNLFYCN
jgi:hypothetical protein